MRTSLRVPVDPPSLRRRPPGREPKRRFLIVCEGEVTERRYFLALRRVTRLHLVEIEPCKGGPRNIVEQAGRRKREAESLARGARDEFLRFDEVWCVFDVDEHPGLQDARRKAEREGIRVAVSNPCFELWALLHFQDQAAHIERDKAKERLRTHLPAYGGELPFDELEPTYSDAVRRAELLEKRRFEVDDPGGNPSTGVYRLTQRLRTA